MFQKLFVTLPHPRKDDGETFRCCPRAQGLKYYIHKIIITEATMNIEKLIKILNTSSPSGCERESIEFVRKELYGICRSETDSMGNLYLYQGANSGLKIMITAHADEVGFQITDINDDGFVYFRKTVGLDVQTIPGTMVTAVTKNGTIDGVIGKRPPHVLSPEEKNKLPNIENLWIDFGFMSKSEALSKIEVGDYIVARSCAFLSNNGRRVISKGLDNKISLFILIELFKLLSRTPLPVQIIGVATTQEELGCRGSIISANKICPDVAFCLDVGIATDTPNWPSHQYGSFSLGKGVGIIRNADNNEILTQVLANTALKHDIPFQYTTGFKPSGGTEAKIIQQSYRGIPTANISIPNRYMHSVVEMCDLQDVEGAIRLLEKGIEAISHFTPSDFYLFK